MNIIAVDDERHALRTIERVIKSENPDAGLSLFNTADEALKYVQANRVDVAFLDIEMRGMNGLTLAKKLKDIYGKTNIIFVTGYSEYAIDALNLYPTGYLLKPVTKENLREAMENLRHPVTPDTEKGLFIRTFGNFEVFMNGKLVHFPRSKSKEMLAYLVHKKGASCTTRELAATLFEDNTETNVRPYISALIKTLEEAGADGVVIKDFNSIAVDTSKFSCDLYRFFKADASAVNEYAGEYMSQYNWGEFIVGVLDEKAKSGKYTENNEIKRK